MKERGLVFGQKCTVSLARYDQDTQSLRMYQCSLFEEEQELLQTLPRQGSIVNGKLSEQTKWELGIEGRESGLWRTPDANMERGKRSYKKMKSRIDRGMPLNLNDQLNAIEKGLLKEPKMFPTPTTQETEHPQAELTNTGRRKSKNGKGSHSLNLADTVKIYTTKEQENTGNLNPMWVEWLMGFPIGWTDLED
mgnify:CR=1 FL=1